jgi:hypothetical protein
MATVTTIARRPLESSLPAPRARIGMIIPSVNSMTEPQFNHFAPPGLGVHVARARRRGMEATAGGDGRRDRHVGEAAR